VRLVAIGLVAGFFSALFGIGGGIVIVSILLLIRAMSERPAMATSLAAIGVTSASATFFYARHHSVEPRYALLLGIPAAFGVVAGTALQQRIPRQRLTLLFAVFLCGIAAWLLLT